MKKQFYKKWWFWAIILGVGLIGSFVQEDEEKEKAPVTKQEDAAERTKEEKKVKEKEPEQTEEEKEEEEEKTRKTYIGSAEEFGYKDIAREPDKYEGKIAKFTGEVTQVVEATFGDPAYRISVNENEYGLWEDVIYVTYKVKDGDVRILEDDIVTIYGELKGLQKYETVLGNKMSIPSLAAKYIVIKD
ncbi:MAG TPA: hypothetical protein GX005_01030 [Bacteroidales bacterium]|nr:hypothetical protein [Bacteroidales bacterium]